MGQYTRFSYLSDLNANPGVSSGRKFLNFVLSLHTYSYFVYANSEGSCEPANVQAQLNLAARRCVSTKISCTGP